jgi:type III secretory pathway component EscS
VGDQLLMASDNLSSYLSKCDLNGTITIVRAAAVGIMVPVLSEQTQLQLTTLNTQLLVQALL